MKFQNVLILATLMCCARSYGQKNTEETIGAKGIKGIIITSDQVFRIDVHTAKTDEITIKSEISGENFETIAVNCAVVNGILDISAARSAFFEDIDDKLAAHKVISIVLNITMPEGLEFWVESSLAAVNMQGVYSLIELNLGRGDCRLNDFRGSGTINTLSGAITVKTENCKIDANSRHGKKKVESMASGSHYLELKSIAGDITVTQSE